MSLLKLSNTFKRKKFNRSSTRGVAALEFVAGFFSFWLMCLFLAEVSYISYVSALGDLMITRATRNTKLVKDEQTFSQAFNDALKEQDSLWKYLVSSQGFQRSIRYVDKFEDLENVTDSCMPKDGESSAECNKPKENEQLAIAIYRVSYNYTPIFSSFVGSQKSVFSREMIVVQEYQRDKFNFGGGS